MTLYNGFNGTHSRLVSAFGYGVDQIRSYITTITGYMSVRLATIWAEDSKDYDNKYIPYTINEKNALVIYFPDNPTTISYKGFSRKNEVKVTGHFHIEKSKWDDIEVTKFVA